MTLHIKVLGGGCANCANLEKNATAAVAGLGVEARIEHVSDPAEYARYGVLYTPGLVINDKLASAGRVPSVAEVTTLLTNVLADAGVDKDAGRQAKQGNKETGKQGDKEDSCRILLHPLLQPAQPNAFRPSTAT